MVYLLNNKFISIVLSSFLTGLSQHFQLLGFLSWFSLVPLLLVFIQCETYKQIIKYSFIWGFVYSLVSVYWIALNMGTNFTVGCISMLLTVLILSSNTILVGVIWFKIKKQFNFKSIYTVPFVWVTIEYIRSYGVLGFPWISLANTQTKYLYLIQNSEFVGIYGISFWIVFLNCLLVILFYQRTIKIFYILCFVFIFPFLSGFLIFKNINIYNDTTLKVSLIQPNFSLNDKSNSSLAKQNLDNLIEKSTLCINGGSNLIIWPESALPFYKLQNKNTLKYISERLFDEQNIFLLTGDVTYFNNKIYNSSVLINKEGIQQFYHKRQLVPMGEYVPLSNKINFLNKINFGQTNFSSGIENIIFNVNNHNFSSLICFESTFPDINREHALKGADFFIYLVNDGWYTTIPEPRQHAKQSIFRAIENRKSVLRCANTGISMVVSPLGEVLQQTKLNTEDIITTFISKSDTITFYTKYGNVFAYLILMVTIFLLSYSIYKNEDNN